MNKEILLIIVDIKNGISERMDPLVQIDQKKNHREIVYCDST